MLLFKTSGETFDSVIRNQKHAFRNMPRFWSAGEIVLVSKNKSDLTGNDKQISYTMRIADIRITNDAEIEQFWPGNAGRWRYIVDCCSTEQVPHQFNLEDVLGRDAEMYRGIMTYGKIAFEHEAVILDFLNVKGQNYTDEVVNEKDYVEGACQKITVNSYERDAEARKKCIDHYKCICHVCGFDFKKRYGELGEGYIHVHHIVPLSEIRQQYRIDPIKDLRPLCANCHVMIHRRRPALTIDELKAIVSR